MSACKLRTAAAAFEAQGIAFSTNCNIFHDRIQENEQAQEKTSISQKQSKKAKKEPEFRLCKRFNKCDSSAMMCEDKALTPKRISLEKRKEESGQKRKRPELRVHKHKTVIYRALKNKRLHKL